MNPIKCIIAELTLKAKRCADISKNPLHAEDMRTFYREKGEALEDAIAYLSVKLEKREKAEAVKEIHGVPVTVRYTEIAMAQCENCVFDGGINDSGLHICRGALSCIPFDEQDTPGRPGKWAYFAGHNTHKALSVKQPYAALLARGLKTIEVRSRNTNYRGELIICSSAKPAIPGLLSGVTCCAVELYDVKRIEDFTAEDWRATCIPPDDRPLEGFGWLVRNPRPVKTVRVKGQLGIYNLNVPEL